MYFPCNEHTISLDHGKENCIAFYSHAHSDHLNKVKKAKKIIASEETIALGNLNGEILDIAAMPNIKLHNAGHILGARQIEVEHDGAKAVYTGDICLRDSHITKGGKILECDKLIIDGTYGSPEYKFPDYLDICDQIANYVKSNTDANIIIGAYELGKTQEIIKVLNELCKVAPVVTENMENFCKVYEKFGVKLDRVEVGSLEAEEIMKSSFVAIVPMRHAKRYFARRLQEAFQKKTLATISTGWALKYRFDVDQAFPLSDHLDFDDLVDYVQTSGAKEVGFIQGDGNKVIEKSGVKRLIF
ncbi:MAG: hypothetical protein AABX38_04425 [Candidatus Micrarchaeota archaeon]